MIIMVGFCAQTDCESLKTIVVLKNIFLSMLSLTGVDLTAFQWSECCVLGIEGGQKR